MADVTSALGLRYLSVPLIGIAHHHPRMLVIAVVVAVTSTVAGEIVAVRVHRATGR